MGSASHAPARHRSADGFQTRVGLGERLLGFAYAVYDHTPFVGHRLKAKRDAHAAMTEPLTTTARLGDVTIVANGLLNLEAPAATLFRLARYTNGPVIVANHNPTNGNALKLRPLVEIEGVPVPEALEGRLFVIGDEAPHITPWTEAADLLVQQLDVLAEALPGLEQQKVAVLGYSQGALSALVARRERPHLIDKVVSLAGALEGTPFGANPVLHAALSAFDPQTGDRALDELTPGFVAQARADQLIGGANQIDLAYGASAEGGGPGVEPFFSLTRKLLPRDAAADGVLATVTPDDALHTVVDPKPKTHLRVWQDWKTVDVVANALPAGWLD